MRPIQLDRNPLVSTRTYCALVTPEHASIMREVGLEMQPPVEVRIYDTQDHKQVAEYTRRFVELQRERGFITVENGMPLRNCINNNAKIIETTAKLRGQVAVSFNFSAGQNLSPFWAAIHERSATRSAAAK